MSADDSSFRVLFLTPAMGVGGVGRQLFGLSKSLLEKGHEVHILSLTPIGNFGHKARSAGISVRSLNVESKLLAPIVVWKIRREIQSFEPDIVHAHLFHAIISGRLASIGLDVTTISTFHNVHDRNPETERLLEETTLRDRVYSLTDTLSAMNTFVSDTAMERYIAAGAVTREKSTRVYNGINVDKFSSSSVEVDRPGGFLWVTVGSIEKRKDHATLLEAVDSLQDTREDFTVWILGEGQLRESLERKARQLGLEHHVEFKGEVYNVPKYLNVADGFVLSSRWEGFGLVVAEAMACGLPVISTDAGGTSEIVVDGETGFLVERGNPDDLAASMATLMELPAAERATYGTNGRQRVKEMFSIESATENWESIYASFA
ncbi:Glycosyltransferase involved in cell wall bisynthesis [Halobiforma haloterrestris]|uniref:Glycosyltransferase involved in cell wall bisynthesis n=1 Tax=Natronobacterium haloterrestre TaxID=148448 RepID=A0A1I1LQZ5_NATHA|nr:glycosyltransferase [Halobiforma haloterrestris]SFC75544.1 Glycosyltransferase involved in cell wall bisynthesis [Halobiforma haloterrestris]